MPPRERQHEGLGGIGGFSFAVGLGAVAGACVDHRSGQTRMPPQERRHEEVFGLGDSFTCSGETRRVLMRVLFFRFCGGRCCRLFCRLLREGRLKVARGRSWQPEIGMEHASRGRRSGNKGVGARWRGRFRIFSARHCSRTKVSHAENSGMTMLFFSLEVAPVSEGDSFHTPLAWERVRPAAGGRGINPLFAPFRRRHPACGGRIPIHCHTTPEFWQTSLFRRPKFAFASRPQWRIRGVR